MYMVVRYGTLEDFEEGLKLNAMRGWKLHSWQNCETSNDGWLIVAVFTEN